MTLEPDEIVTSIIAHEILPSAMPMYEKWLAEIRQACAKFDGYLSTDVIRPLGKEHTYVVIIRFDGFEKLARWMESDQRRAFLQQMEPFLTKGDRYQIRTGLEFWFTPPAGKPAIPWKQFLVTWSAIFPLSLLVTWLLGPLFDHMSFSGAALVARLVNTALIVVLMVYVVMPRYTKLVSKWLFR
jgi:uncharacterized protein